MDDVIHLVGFIAGAGDLSAADGVSRPYIHWSGLSSGQMHGLKLDDARNLWMFPRKSSSRVLMNKMLISSKLSSIKFATKVEVPDALLNCKPDFLRIHLSIVDLSIPYTESCTWGRTDNPIVIIFIDHLRSEMPICFVVKVPRSPIWFESP